MVRRLPERVFNPSEPLVATKSFRANGRHYKPGDAFDWKKQSLDQRRVRQMFDARYLVAASEYEQPKPKKTKVEEKPKPAAKKETTKVSVSKPATVKKGEGE